jgi:hypothetical protein
MWKRETPPIAGDLVERQRSARWLSMYQSAFWAGFMAQLPAKRRHLAACAARFDSPCSSAAGTKHWHALRL